MQISDSYFSGYCWLCHIISQNSMIFPWLFIFFQSPWFFHVWNFFSDFSHFPWFPELVGTLTELGKSCSTQGFFNIANMSFNIICGNKILAKISEFTIVIKKDNLPANNPGLASNCDCCTWLAYTVLSFISFVLSSTSSTSSPESMSILSAIQRQRILQGSNFRFLTTC